MKYITYSEYESIAALRASEMKHLLRSPAHYMHAKNSPSEDSFSKKIGRALHSALLEPDKFDAAYTCMDDSAICDEIGGAKPRGTNKYREWKAEFERLNTGKEILPIESLHSVRAMSAAILKNECAKELLLSEGENEATICWEDADTGVKLKARIDRLLSSGKILDVKSCDDARPHAFERSLFNFGYYLQAAVYSEAVSAGLGKTVEPFFFICVENSAPWCVQVYELDSASLEIGKIHMQECLRLFKFYSEADLWPGYDNVVRKISLQNWAVRS